MGIRLGYDQTLDPRILAVNSVVPKKRPKMVPRITITAKIYKNTPFIFTTFVFCWSNNLEMDHIQFQNRQHLQGKVRLWLAFELPNKDPPASIMAAFSCTSNHGSLVIKTHDAIVFTKTHIYIRICIYRSISFLNQYMIICLYTSMLDIRSFSTVVYNRMKTAFSFARLWKVVEMRQSLSSRFVAMSSTLSYLSMTSDSNIPWLRLLMVDRNPARKKTIYLLTRDV